MSQDNELLQGNLSKQLRVRKKTSPTLVSDSLIKDKQYQATINGTGSKSVTPPPPATITTNEPVTKTTSRYSTSSSTSSKSSSSSSSSSSTKSKPKRKIESSSSSSSESSDSSEDEVKVTKKVPATKITTVSSQSIPSDLPVKRRAKSVGGNVTSTTTTSTTLPPTTSTTSTSSSNKSNLKRKSVEIENMFQSDRFNDDSNDNEVEDKKKKISPKKSTKSTTSTTTTTKSIPIRFSDDGDDESTFVPPVKDTKKARYSVSGSKTRWEIEKESQLEKEKQEQEAKEKEMKKKQEERQKEMERLEKENQRKRDIDERLKRIQKSMPIKQPQMPITSNLIGKTQPLFNSNITPPPTTPSINLTKKTTEQKHVYPKTPIPQKGYMDTPESSTKYYTPKFPYTQETQPKSKLNSSISFDTDDNDINTFTQQQQHEYMDDDDERIDGVEEFYYPEGEQEMEQEDDEEEERFNRRSIYDEIKKSTSGLEKRSPISYFLVVVTFFTWILLLVTLFNFFYTFNDVKYCDNETLPKYINGRFSCQPCPDKGICFRGNFYTCLNGFVKKGNECIVDPTKIETMSSVLNKVDEILRTHKGRYECGVVDQFDMSFDQLEVEFNRRFWIKNTNVISSFENLIDHLDRHHGTPETLGMVDKKLLASITSTYEKSDSQYHYYTSNDPIRPLWCQSMFYIKRMFMNYLPVIVAVVVAYVMYKYYRFSKIRKQQEILLVEDYYNQTVQLLQARLHDSEVSSWVSEINLRDDIMGNDTSPHALKIWDKVLAKIYLNNRIFATARLVHGESLQTFEWTTQ